MKPEASMMSKPLASLNKVAVYAKRFPSLDQEGFRTYLMVRNLQTRMTQGLEVSLGRYGLSFGRFMVLVHLIQAEGHQLTPAELATLCGVTRATVTGLVDTLEKARYVTREADPADRRSLLVRLTMTGQRFLEKMLPEHFNRLSRFMGALTRAEQKTMQAFCNTLTSAVGVLEKP